MTTVDDVLQEAQRLPDTAAARARELGDVVVPQVFGALRARVCRDHYRLLAAVDRVVYTRFGYCHPTTLAVLRTAAELAVMEQCARSGLRTADRAYLRRAWNTLRTEPTTPLVPPPTRQHTEA